MNVKKRKTSGKRAVYRIRSGAHEKRETFQENVDRYHRGGALLFASNAIWLWAWTSYDYYSETVTVDSGEGGNANYIGQDGDIYNGDGYSQEKNSQEEGSTGEKEAQGQNP